MNVEAMLAVADVIEYMDRFNLEFVVCHPDHSYAHEETSIPQLWESCGTVGCVGGWTLAWADINVPNEYRYWVPPEDLQWVQRARKELGLTQKQAVRLFFADDNGSIWYRLADEYGWERSFRGGLYDWSEIKAPQAADVMRRIARKEIKL